MNGAALRSLSRVLRAQLAAVQQHFIHVLLLRTWREEAVADRITSIDAVDLPNAMRIVDSLVSAGHLPALAGDRATLARDTPEPGASPGAVVAAELALDLRLSDVLASAAWELTRWAGEVPIELVSVPLSSRAGYQDWLRRRVVDSPRGGAVAGAPEDAAGLAPDALFANLMVMINQTLVHAFVHWHRRDHDLADATWEMSGAAMMHATSIVETLAPRHAAPQPARAVARGDVGPPRLAAARPEALANDRLLAERCRAAAGRAAVAQRGEAGLEAACGRIEAWYAELGGWRPGRALPRIDNPCVDFERVLREHVWHGRRGSASSAKT